MKGWKILSLLAVAAAVSSCGGGSAVADQRLFATYVGTWTGPWSSVTLGSGGTVTLVINADGTFDATKSTVSVTGSTSTTPITGSMDSSGKFSATMLGWKLQGQQSNATGPIIGYFKIIADSTYDGTWTLTKQAATTG